MPVRLSGDLTVISLLQNGHASGAKDAKESATVAESIKPMEEAQKVVVSQVPTLAVWVPNLIFVASTKFEGYLSYPSSNNGAISMASLLNLKPRK